jgi:hypothetical protein
MSATSALASGLLHFNAVSAGDHHKFTAQGAGLPAKIK